MIGSTFGEVGEGVTETKYVQKRNNFVIVYAKEK